MAKKIFVTAFAIIILCLCCGVCFAAEDTGSSINLGNEIMNSLDKTGKSINNVVSGNIVKDASNNIKDGARNAGNDVKDGARDAGNEGRNIIDGVVDRTNNGMYNTTRTTAEGTTNTGFSTMTTTTWMWIILVVAAIVIIAAIWYYATRTND